MSRLALKKSFLSILPFVVACLVGYFFYFFSVSYSQKIAALISSQIDSQVAIQRAEFSLTSGIRIQGVVFTDPSGQTISFGEMIFQHSFKELWNRRLVFKKITIDGVNIEIRQGGPAPSLTRWVELLGDQKKKENQLFDVEFRKAKICFHDIQIGVRMAQAPDDRKTVMMELCLDSEANRVRCEGKLDFQRSTFFQGMQFLDLFKRRYFDFLIEYEPLGGDLVVNQIKIQNGQFMVAGSGVIREFNGDAPQLDLSVHSDPFRIEQMPSLRELKPQGGEVAMIGRLTGPMDNATWQGEWIMPTLELSLENDILQVGQFLCRTSFHFKDQAFSLDECRGIVDESLQFLATGNINRLFDPIIRLRVQLMQVANAPKPAEETSLVIALQGKWTDGVFGGKADFRYGTINGREYSCVLRDFQFIKNELLGKRRQVIFQGQGVRIVERLVKEKEKSVIQNFDFDKINLALGFVGKRTYIEDLTILGYAGSMVANGSFYLSPRLKECALSITANDLDLNNVQLSYPFFCIISGILNGNIEIISKKDTVVKGVLSAQQFGLSKLEPLNQVADFIGIDSIKEIKDAQVVVDFELSPNASVIKRFDVDSHELGMRSNYQIDLKNWFEGEIALSLPRSTLEQSKIFKTLMSIARERNNLLDFVVRLSGYLWQLRTELVKSDLRDKLKDRVSVGIQKHIEREANKAMEGGN